MSAPMRRSSSTIDLFPFASPMCGSKGGLLLEATHSAESRRLIETMLRVTMMRGAQSAGVRAHLASAQNCFCAPLMEHDKPCSHADACSQLVTYNPSAKGIRQRVVNGKRTDLCTLLLRDFNEMASGRTSEPGSGCSSRVASPYSSPKTSPRTLAARVLSGMVEDDPPQIGGHMIAFQHASNFSSLPASLQMLGNSFMAQDKPSAPPPPARRPAPYPQRPVCPTPPSKLPRDVTPCAPLHAPLHAPSARCAALCAPSVVLCVALTRRLCHALDARRGPASVQYRAQAGRRSALTCRHDPSPPNPTAL